MAMASHHLTIAKASFTASLLLPEAVPLTRDSIAEFHTLLDAAIARCTFSNIQKCKSWILTTITPFPARSTAFGKYLVSLSKHLPTDDSAIKGPQSTGLTRATAISRRRLHILYLLNDLLHHTRHHVQGNKEFSILTSSLQPFLADLVASVASDAKPKVRRRVDTLMEIWRSEHYFAGDFLTKLRSVVDDSSKGAGAPTRAGDSSNDHYQTLPVKEPPYIMPPTHGDVNTPYYDLPAGNLLPHMIPNSTVAIRPENVRPLQFMAGPADESLVQALKDFMQDVDRIDNEMSCVGKDAGEDGLVAEIDELGQVLWKDEKTGEIVKGDTYYGWSREFCEKMKRRRKGVQALGNGRARSRSYSSSMSRSRSRSPSRDGHRMKRRYSSSRSRSRSYSRSQSPRSQNRRRSYTPSESDTNTRPILSTQTSSTHPLPAQPQSFIPASSTTTTPFPPNISHQQQIASQPPPPFPIPPFASNSSTPPFPVPPPPPPFGLGPNPSLNVNNIPFPPPRPAGYTGPWPPPPPPPPNMSFGPAGSPPPPPMGMGMGSYGQGGPSAPPPPGPQGAGRGGYGGGGNNRGGGSWRR